MFKNIENLEIKDIIRGTTKKNNAEVFRKSSAIIIRTSGCMRYTFPNCTYDVHQGEVIFLPKESHYRYCNLSDAPCEYISIRFEADLVNPSPSMYSMEHFADSEEIINTLPDLWRLGRQAEHYQRYALFYSLLAYMENQENITYADKKKASVIAPAITYLKTHIYDEDLKMETLHHLCGISSTYFRNIFHEIYNISPQKYILSKRLSHAKTIIDSGDYDLVAEISAMVGYSDPLYFSRAFKKKFGVSPSQYAKE